MGIRFFRIAYLLSLFFFTGLTIAITVFLWSFNYDNFTLLIVKSANKPEILDLVKNRFFSLNKFLFTRYLFVLLSISLILLLPFLIKKSKDVSVFLNRIFEEFLQLLKLWWFLIKGETKIQQVFSGFLFLSLLIKTSYYLQYPVQYDEAWTYNYFVSNNLLVAFSVYNNHPLFVVLANLFSFLPFPVSINLRLPVVIFGFLAVFAFFAYLRRLFSFWMSISGAYFFAFSGPVTFYMLYARGYILLTFFVIVSSYSLFRWLINTDPTTITNPKKWRIILILSCIAGFYAMPTFIYHFAVIFLFGSAVLIFNKRFKLFWELCKSTGLIFLGIVLVYTPMLLGTGIGLGFQVATEFNTIDWVWKHFPKYINRSWYFLTGTAIHSGIILLFSLLIIWAYRNANKYQRQWTWFSLMSISTIIIAFLLQRVYVPERIWTYNFVFISFLFVLVLQNVYEKLSCVKFRQFVVGGFVFLAVSTNLYLAHQNDFINWSYQRDTNSEKIARLFMNHNVELYYFNLDYYKPLIEFHYKSNGRLVKQISGNPQSVDYQPFDIHQNYDAILWDNCFALPEGLNELYLLQFSDDEITVWLRKEQKVKD